MLREGLRPLGGQLSIRSHDVKLSATNGNSRNRIRGQRVTLTTRCGFQFITTYPAGGALRRPAYQARLLQMAQGAAWFEGCNRHGEPQTDRAAQMLQLFTQCKARMLVQHGRWEVGHVR